MKKTWEETKLWKILSKKISENNKEILPFLKTILDDISIILDSANTSLSTFTLHDSDHSFRVAERMVEIIPRKTFNSLSIYELALLLLSAYLHDIGMTPLGNKISDHHDYLLSGEKGSLSDIEIDKFDIWLLDEKRNLRAPLGEGAKSKKDLKLARELTDYYFRDIHNDLSKGWIEHNIKEEKLLNYLTFRTDLITLCQSHNWNFDKLENEKYSLKTTNDGLNINMKFLFCMLRMGDILENDPERTPKTIYKYREVFPSSEKYWYRDQSLQIIINTKKESKEICIKARPKNAVLQKAIEELIESINDEIIVCSKLLHNRLSNCYIWNLNFPTLNIDIKPFRDSYTYIKGNFKINIEKTLQLLGGIELYKDPIIAIRELLQNAFDAVKLQIALEQIDNINSSKSIRIDDIRKSHLVKLTFKYENENVYLECEDDGIGMTKSIIENSLLFIGEKSRPDIDRIRHSSEKLNIKLDLSSQFGIGFLSYFMIADEIIIETKRHPLFGDGEDSGWIFIINGIGEWGELKAKKIKKTGTTVRLKLKTEEFYRLNLDGILNRTNMYFRNYISEMFSYLPCCFKMYSKLSNKPLINYPPGWTPITEINNLKNDNDVSDFMMNNKKIKDFLNPNLIKFEEDISKFDELKKEAEYIIGEIKKSESFSQYEDELPDNLGSYRIFLPKYSISNEDSEFYYLEKKQNENINSDGKKYKVIKGADEHQYEGYRQYGSILISYCGFKIEKCDIFTKYSKYGFFIFDFKNEKHCKLSIDRTVLTLSQEAQYIVENCIDKIFEKRIRSIYENKLSPFYFMNLLFYNKFEDNLKNICWINHKDEIFTFNNLQLPAMPITEIDDYQTSTTEKYTLNDDNVSIVPKVIIGTSKCKERFDTENRIIFNCFQSADPSEIIYIKDYNDIKLCCFWATMKKQIKPRFYSCDFPQDWREFVFIEMPSGLKLWNRSFPFFEDVIKQQLAGNRYELFQYLSMFNFNFDLIPKHYFNINFTTCIQWLSTFADFYQMSEWGNLKDNNNYLDLLFQELNSDLKYGIEKIIVLKTPNKKNIIETEEPIMAWLQSDDYKILKDEDKILEIMNVQANCRELKIKKEDDSKNSFFSSLLKNYR